MSLTHLLKGTKRRYGTDKRLKKIRAILMLSVVTAGGVLLTSQWTLAEPMQEPALNSKCDPAGHAVSKSSPKEKAAGTCNSQGPRQQPLAVTVAANADQNAGQAVKSRSAEEKKYPPPASREKAIEKVTVEAQRASEAIARQAQFEAPNLITIQTYNEIQKLPDVSLAEAVRRVPGISMETDEGEGRYIDIRGFDADLNSTTFDGLRLMPTNNASPFGGYRAVALDSIPTGLIGAVTVTKSNLPSQDAEALGGTIDVAPKTAPPGSAPFIQGNVGTGYEPLRGTPIYDVGVTAGSRFGGGGGAPFFGEGPFSLVLTGSYYEDKRGIDDLEPAYFNAVGHSDPQYWAVSNVQQRDYQLRRRRHSFGIDLGYQPNDGDNYYIRAFEAGYTERYFRQFLNLTPDGNTVTLANGQLQDTLNGPTAIQKALRDETETSRERVVMAGGKNAFGDAILDYRAAFVEGSYIKPYDYNSAFDYAGPLDPVSGATITYGPSGKGHTPLYTIAGTDYLNPANYTLDPGFNNSTQDNFDKEYSFAANLQLITNWLGADSESLTFGASARLRHKGEQAQPYSYANLPVLPLTSAMTGGNEIYYAGQYQNLVDITPGYLQSRFGSGTIAGGDALGALQQFLDARESVFAGYGEYQFAFGPLSVVAGVRVENTVDHTTTWATGVDSAGNPITPILVHGEKNYINFFPSVQAKYQIESNLVARATYSSTLARPGFNQFAPSTSFDIGSLTVTTGNPNLKPALAHSFDVSLEKYLDEGGIVSLGFFDKEISNYIVPNTLTGQKAPSFTQINDPVILVTFTNATGSYARGVEFNWEQRFTELPGLLSGLGAGGNFTYVDSSYDIRPGERAALPSTSRWTWNAMVFYEMAPVTLRLAAYSVSTDLFGIGGDRTGDILNPTRTYLDFGSSYALNNNLALYFNANNLLDTPTTYAQGTVDRPIQREFYGETYQIGIRFNY